MTAHEASGLIKRPEFEAKVDAVYQIVPPNSDRLLPKGGHPVLMRRLALWCLSTHDLGGEVEYYCHDHIRRVRSTTMTQPGDCGGSNRTEISDWVKRTADVLAEPCALRASTLDYDAQSRAIGRKKSARSAALQPAYFVRGSLDSMNECVNPSETQVAAESRSSRGSSRCRPD